MWEVMYNHYMGHSFGVFCLNFFSAFFYFSKFFVDFFIVILGINHSFRCEELEKYKNVDRCGKQFI